MSQPSPLVTPVMVRDLHVSWGRMFNLVGKFFVVATIYSIALGIIWAIFWVAVIQTILDS